MCKCWRAYWATKMVVDTEPNGEIKVRYIAEYGYNLAKTK